MTEEKTVSINGSRTAVASANTTTLEIFLSDLNKDLAKQNQVVSTIKINGRELTESDEMSLKNTPLERVIQELGPIEVQTMNPMDLAYETLGTLDLYVDRLGLSIQRAAHLYQQKNLLAGDTYFTKAIDGLDLFIQTIGGVKMALRIGLNQDIALTEASLVSIMNDLLSAKRENNYLFLAELLEKDLIENLNDWKTKAFPAMRMWKTA